MRGIGHARCIRKSRGATSTPTSGRSATAAARAAPARPAPAQPSDSRRTRSRDVTAAAPPRHSPAGFRPACPPFSRHIIGPFQRKALCPSRDRDQRIEQGKRRHETAQRDPWPAFSVGRINSVAAKLPGTKAQGRPRRPREAVCSSARIHVGPPAPAAIRAACALVLSRAAKLRTRSRLARPSSFCPKYSRRRRRPCAGIPRNARHSCRARPRRAPSQSGSAPPPAPRFPRRTC